MENLKKLLKQAESAMASDINRIEHYGKTKKLTPGYARDLRDYVKILTLIIKEEKDALREGRDKLSSMSDEELRIKAKELLDE